MFDAANMLKTLGIDVADFEKTAKDMGDAVKQIVAKLEAIEATQAEILRLLKDKDGK